MIRKLLFLLMLCVTSMGAWGQAQHTSYKFNAASDGTLFMDANGETPATYAANDPCVGTYYLQVNKQHTTAPATKDGPKTFNVKDYYVDGVCTYGQEYDDLKAYTKVDPATLTEITNENKEGYVTSALFWTAGAVNAGVHKSDLSGEYPADSGEPIVEGGVCDPNGHYWVNGGDQLGSTVAQYQNWSMSGIRYATESTAFKPEFANNIYTIVDDEYVKVTSNVYDPSQTYYYVTFTDAAASDVAAETNFKVSKLYDLTDVTGTIYHKNGTSYDVVVDGEPFIDDDEYYVDGTSYQPCTPAELAALDYATGTTTYYDCDVVKTADQITITYHAYGNNNFLNYFTDCAGDIANHANVVVKSTESSHGTVDAVKSIIAGINNAPGVVNLVLEEIANTDAGLVYDFRDLTNTDVKRIIIPSKTEYTPGYPTTRGEINSIAALNEDIPVVIESVATFNITGEHRCFVLSPTAGSLSAIKDFHYYSDGISACPRQEYSGNIDATDIDWFTGVNVPQLDLSAINTSDEHLADVKTALHSLENNNIEYVVFPDLKVKPEDPLYTDFLTNCPSVIAVGQFTSTDKTFTAYAKETGKLSILTNMLADLTNSNASIENVKLSGNLNALDLNGGATVIDPETGHLGVYKTSYDVQGWTAKDGVTPIGSGALDGVQLHDVNLKDAYFEIPEDMTLSAFGIFYPEAKYPITVEMPTDSRMTVVPPCFMEKIRTFSTVCVPENYTTIKAGAFYQCGVSHINTTKNGEVLDYGETAWTLSSTLELIEEGAFWTNVTGGVTDVYALRYEPTTIVPVTVCQMNSFPSGMYYGWGGFAGNTAHPIQRSNYKNNEFYFTILHYPAGMPDVQRAKYTDITRQYSFFDETGATDDDGLLYRWPSMEQFYRAYNQAVAGVTWDAWWQSNQIIESYAAVHEWSGDQYIEQLPVTHGKAYKFDPTTDTSITYRSENDETSGWKDGWWNPSEIYFTTPSAQTSTVPYLSSPATSYDNLAEKYKYDIDNFAGWHQFVLVGSTNYEHIDEPDPDPYWDFAKYKDNDWYTICLPFSLTKAELAKIFGNPDYSGSDEYTYKFPDVRTLAGVTRNIPSKHVLIQLSDNLMKHKLLRESDGSSTMTTSGTKLVPVYSDDEVEDEDIVLEADKPYFIKPILPLEEQNIANAGRRAIQYSKKDADALIATHVPNVTIHVNARNANETKYLDWKDTESETVPAQPYKYYFLGNYIPQIMPMHAYYLGVKGGKSTIFRNSKSNRSWTTYNCVMGAIANEKTSVSIKGQGVEGKVENSIVEFKNEDDFTFSRKDDGKGEHAAKASFMFEFTEEEGTVTGLMQMNANGSMTFIKDNTPVYSINGQIVGNSIQNLPSGVYVVNGKKYIK